jgi:hypothetical protein
MPTTTVRSPVLPENPREAELLFAAMRLAERRLELTPDDAEVVVEGEPTWTLPIDDRYVLWIWTYAWPQYTPPHPSILVRGAITSTSNQTWTFGTFESLDSTDVVGWLLDAAMQDLDDARQRSVQTARVRHLQRKSAWKANSLPTSKPKPKAKRAVKRLQTSKLKKKGRR